MKHEQSEVMSAVMALSAYAPDDADYTAKVGILLDYITDVVELLNEARKENESLAKALLQLTNGGVNNREGRRKLRNKYHINVAERKDEVYDISSQTDEES